MTMAEVLVGGVRRFRAHALTPTTIKPELDEAGLSLRSLAGGVVLRAHEIIETCAAASHGPIELRGYASATENTDRAWRFSYNGRHMFCTVDDGSERLLLSWIVGGRHIASALSTIERSIVEESVRRILSVAAHGASVDIEAGSRLGLSERTWRCHVQFRSADGQCVTIRLFTQGAPPPQTSTLPSQPDLRDVALHLRASLPGVACALSEVWQWRRGSVLRLQRLDRDISVGLYAGGYRVALARLGTVFGDRAVKLVAVGSQVHP